MKALYFEKHGGLEVMQYGEIDTPIPESGEALIQVKAVALNHLDIWIRRGWPGLKLAMPHVTGADISGIIKEINTPNSNFTVGDRVGIYPGVVSEEDEYVVRGEESLSPFYSVIGEHRSGGCAEYVTVPVRNLFPILEDQPFENAAAPNLVATTVWRMLVDRGELQTGETILVVGSGGGVNSLSVQIASAIGAKVICLAGSAQKAKKIADLGAAETILYKEDSDWHRTVHRLTDGKGVDLVVDNVGEASFTKSLKALRPGGRLVTVGNTSGYKINLDNRLIFGKQLSVIGSTMGSQQNLKDCLQFMKERDIQIPIDTIAPLSDGINQLKRLEAGEQFGKIVLTP